MHVTFLPDFLQCFDSDCWVTEGTRDPLVNKACSTHAQLFFSRMCILLSQQMLDAIKHITDDNFFFQEDSAPVYCACNTVQLSENVILAFSRFAR